MPQPEDFDHYNRRVAEVRKLHHNLGIIEDKKESEDEEEGVKEDSDDDDDIEMSMQEKEKIKEH